MSRICDKCYRVHKGKCAQRPTLAQMKRETEKFLRTLEAVSNRPKTSGTQYGTQETADDVLDDLIATEDFLNDDGGTDEEKERK